MWGRLSILLLSLISCAEKDNAFQSHSGVIVQNDSTICPPEGITASKHIQELNRLKNRVKFPAQHDFDGSITSARILEEGNDKQRWNDNTAVRIRGYISAVKTAGPETCNCKSKDKNERDTHMEISLTPMEENSNKIIVVEVTPRIRKIMKEKGIDWSTRSLRDQFLGRFVEVEGWLFYDSEHEKNAMNTNPSGKKIWRQTAWEIHPVTKISVITKLPKSE